jgi:hypothetical protein
MARFRNPIVFCLASAACSTMATAQPPVFDALTADAFLSADGAAPPVLGACVLSDLDGDGQAEIALLSLGRIEIRSGRTREVLQVVTMTLSGGDNATVLAPTADLDNDGLPDIAAGRIDRDFDGISPDVVEIYSTGDGALLRTLVGPTDNNSGFGNRLAPIPDIDGDGVDDLVVGAFSADDPVGVLDEYGYVGLFSLGTGEPIWERYGAYRWERLGTSLAVVDDLDGDLLPDVLVGAAATIDVGGRWGGAFVLSSADGAELRAHEGLLFDAFFGAAAASFPDIDGDGVGDYAIGAPDDFLGGSIRLYSGLTGSQIAMVSGGGFGADGFGAEIVPIDLLSPAGAATLLTRVHDAPEAPLGGYIGIDAATRAATAIVSGRPNIVADNAPLTVGDIDGDGAPDIAYCYRQTSSNQSGLVQLHLSSTLEIGADLNGDGVVDGADLGLLLGFWGPR